VIFMSDDFPTYAEVGESNIRVRNRRLGLRFHRLGTPMTIVDIEEERRPHPGAEARV